MKRYLIYVITPGATFGPKLPPNIRLHNNDDKGFESIKEAQNYAAKDNYINKFKYIIVDVEELKLVYHNSE